LRPGARPLEGRGLGGGDPAHWIALARAPQLVRAGACRLVQHQCWAVWVGFVWPGVVCCVLLVCLFLFLCVVERRFFGHVVAVEAVGARASFELSRASFLFSFFPSLFFAAHVSQLLAHVICSHQVDEFSHKLCFVIVFFPLLFSSFFFSFSPQTRAVNCALVTAGLSHGGWDG